MKFTNTTVESEKCDSTQRLRDCIQIFVPLNAFLKFHNKAKKKSLCLRKIDFTSLRVLSELLGEYQYNGYNLPQLLCIDILHQIKRHVLLVSS